MRHSVSIDHVDLVVDIVFVILLHVAGEKLTKKPERLLSFRLGWILLFVTQSVFVNIRLGIFDIFVWIVHKVD